MQYFDPQLRSPGVEARQKLMAGKCTMAQHPTLSRYEQEFRRLCRDCPDLSLTDQICWFIAGLTPELKRNCVTMPDGTDWRDLPALIQFAHGVEARTIAATENHPSQPKRPRLAHATCDVAATQASQSRNKPRPQTRGKENAGPSGVATAPPAAVPGRFHGLWRHSLAKGWRDVGGRPYKEDGVRWMEVVNARECLNCHRSLATPSAEGGCSTRLPCGKVLP